MQERFNLDYSSQWHDCCIGNITLEKGTNDNITGGGKTISFKAAQSNGRRTTLLSSKDGFKVSDINVLG